MRLAILSSTLLAAALGAAEPAADAYAERIKALEAEMRSLVDEQARSVGAAGATVAPDYAAAKARAADDVRRRLQIVEYHLADNDYARAVEACNAILRDHPHEPATVRLKYRVLMAMVERERALLERERQYRADEALADGQARSVVPKDGPKLARTVWVFDEDIEEAERAAVRKRLQSRVTLNYEGVQVGEVLKPLFATAGINYVILDEALPSQTLTLHLVDDTVENALKTIAKLVDVRYNYSANTVFIGAADSEVMVSEIIRLASGLTDVMTELQMPQASGGSESGGQSPQGQPQNQQGQPGQVNSDVERFLEKVPDIVSGWPSEGKLYLDRKSNTLYARATPAAIGELKRLLRAMDYQSAQILIETKFVIVSDGFEKRLGIDWGGASLGDSVNVTGPSGSVFGPTGITPAAGNATAATAGGPGGLLAQVLFSPDGRNSPGIFAAIRALEEEKKAQVLSEPRILTINNSLGKIKLTRDYEYVKKYIQSSQTTGVTTPTDTTSNTVGTSVSTPTFTPETDRKELGYTLEIRPSIARNSDTITLEIRPLVTDLSGENFTQRIEYVPSAGQAPRNFEYTTPGFLTRALATTMHVKNGQTVVLGGLTTEETSTNDNGVPGVRRVPLLGRLFSSSHDKITRSNLLIFVTAHIIDPSGAKIGEEVRRLRDTAAVVLPEEIRLAEAEKQADEAKRAADAEAAAKEAAKPATNRPRTGKLAPRD